MDISVVVPTLNARDELADCLDALSQHVPTAEVIVVNGPSADGTTGMVCERDDVSVLVELADRTINAARNAGIDRASADIIAFLDHRYTVGPEWRVAIEDSLNGSAVVTGPIHPRLHDESAADAFESRSIAGREVVYFNAGNVAFTRSVLDEFDGYDEYLHVGGSRDLAHRIAGTTFTVTWDDRMRVTEEASAIDERHEDWGWKYRSLSYRLVKNYNLRPTVIGRILSHAATDGTGELRTVFAGEKRFSSWVSNGRRVASNSIRGCFDGLRNRRLDRSRRRNPSGRSSRADRAVTVYDWR